MRRDGAAVGVLRVGAAALRAAWRVGRLLVLDTVAREGALLVLLLEPLWLARLGVRGW